MAYSSDTNDAITNFINRAQTRIGISSTAIANGVGKGHRPEKYSDKSEEAFLLDAFIRSLDNTFNDWTEAEIIRYISFWTAQAKLNDVPYFTHTAYNLNIVVSTTTNFIPSVNLNMLGLKITGLAAGTGGSDAVNKGQLDTKVAKAGDTMSGPLAMGAQKITGLAAATQNGDAVRYEQIPTSLPPSGVAGGDLGGTYPNPSVNDDSHSHTPGNSIPAYPTSLPPSGAAGGDLSGTYPNPNLRSGISFPQEAWSNLVLINGWAVQPGVDIAQYFKDTVGDVHIRGALNSDDVTGGDTTLPFAVLPAGYRPSRLAYLPTLFLSNTVLNIQTDGTLFFDTAVPSGNAFDIEGLRFSTN